MKFLILMTCYLLACEGAPIIPQEPIAVDTPCLNRQVVVEEENTLLDGVVESHPHYYPECEDDGVYWKPIQCDYHGDEIACFCVDITTGLPLNNVRLPIYHKDSLHCGSIDTQSNCAQDRYRKPGVVCTADGKFFKALQIRESTYSCVDVISGEPISGTTGRHTDVINLLTEEVCQAYSERWQAFKKSNRGASNNRELGHSENDTEESCLPGFIFDESACPTTCVPGQDMLLTPPPPCNQFKPTCVCPNGSYEWNNTCIDVEQCKELSFHDEINEISWKEFLQNEMNEVIAEYLRVRSEWNENSFNEESPSSPEEENNFNEESHSFPEEENNFNEESPSFPEEENNFNEESPSFPEEENNFNEESPSFPEEENNFNEESPSFPEEENNFNEESPSFPEEETNSNENVLDYGDVYYDHHSWNPSFPEETATSIEVELIDLPQPSLKKSASTS